MPAPTPMPGQSNPQMVETMNGKKQNLAATRGVASVTGAINDIVRARRSNASAPSGQPERLRRLTRSYETLGVISAYSKLGGLKEGVRSLRDSKSAAELSKQIIASLVLAVGNMRGPTARVAMIAFIAGICVGQLGSIVEVVEQFGRTVFTAQVNDSHREQVASRVNVGSKINRIR